MEVESIVKVSVKRKINRNDKVSKQAKKVMVYIILFLQEIKGLKGVEVQDYFPNLAQFVKDTKYLVKEGAFSDLEVFRLRKFVNKIKKEINS